MIDVYALLTEWSAVGGSAAEFWQQTPRDHAAFIAGAVKRAERDHSRDIALAWKTANFTRATKLKPLKHFLPRKPGETPAGQVDAQAGLAQWAAHLSNKAKK